MSEIRERVARAMYESDMQEEYGLAESYHSWESLLTIEPQQYEIVEYRSRARAAIDAHKAALAEAGFVIVPREPTEAMIEAGAACFPYGN